VTEFAAQASLAEVMASLQLGIGRLTARLDQDAERRRKLTLAIAPIVVDPIPMNISGGNGFLDVPQMLGPTMGRYWDVQSITCEGFSAGSVRGYINGVQIPTVSGFLAGRLIAPFPQDGVLTLGSGPPCMLRGTGKDRLVFAATGITLRTGFAQVMISLEGTQVLDEWIGEYLK